MVNHPNRKKIYPDQTLEQVARKAGATVLCMWEIPGPSHVSWAWLTCYGINGTVCLVQTYRDGNGWEAYTPCGSNDVATTIADVLNRCGVPV
jgi:hypothetical protein